MEIVHTVCVHDCGGCCPLDVYVEDGKVVKIESRDVGNPSLRACARGLLYHYRLYSDDRLQYPLRRSGERGEGKFTRITWDEALDTVADEIRRIRDRYGLGAIFNMSFAGAVGRLTHSNMSRDFFNALGGHSTIWGGASFQGGYFASLATYGDLDTANDPADLLHSKMIILWGCSPAESIFGSETRWYVSRAKRQGTRVVCIDPRYTATAAGLANTWLPVRPGTDAAVGAAMANVILRERLEDRAFLAKYTLGFDRFEAYISGQEDGVAKTPAWAASISGLAAEDIERLAVEYATSKPAAILPGFAPGRTAAGEQYHRMTAVLAAMTGNIGVSGGSAACLNLGWGATPSNRVSNPKNYFQLHCDLPPVPNPLEAGQPLHEYAVGKIRTHTADKVHPSKVWDALVNGKAGGYANDIKMLFIMAGDALNQLPDANKGVQALKGLEFFVIQDMFITPTARYADIVLPVATWLERNDIRLPWLSGHYAILSKKAVEAPGECKTDYEIFTLLCERLDVKGFHTKTVEEWLRTITADRGIPDYEAFQRTGFYREKQDKPFVALQPQMQDPTKRPFSTPSGKIEIFSQQIADWGRPEQLPPVPKYVPTWEGPEEALSSEFPLQVVTTHSRQRIHSQFHNVPWFRGIEPHQVWVNSTDAATRGIEDGDQVRVYNGRGEMRIAAKVTERIMPGVVGIYQGAWYEPDEAGIDRGGCVNVLMRGEHSPGGAFVTNTALVQIAKA